MKRERDMHEVANPGPAIERHTNVAGSNQLIGSHNFIPKFP
jgi:hypothetical protein